LRRVSTYGRCLNENPRWTVWRAALSERIICDHRWLYIAIHAYILYSSCLPLCFGRLDLFWGWLHLFFGCLDLFWDIWSCSEVSGLVFLDAWTCIFGVWTCIHPCDEVRKSEISVWAKRFLTSGWDSGVSCISYLLRHWILGEGQVFSASIESKS